jgi:integrase
MPKNNKNWINVENSQNIYLRARKNKNSYSLYLDFRINSKRIYENLHLRVTTVNKRYWNAEDKIIINIARKIMSERALQILNNEYKIVNKQDTDFIQYFKLFVERKKNINSRDKFKWIGAYKHLCIFVKEQPILFKQIDLNFLEELKTYLLDNLARNSAASYFSLYNQVLKNALREGIIQHNPMELLEKKISAKQTKREYLTFDELKILASTKCRNDETKYAFLFCCFTGLRFSDARALRWKHIRDENGKKIMYIRQMKTKELLAIPLSDSAIKYLGERKNNEDKVFQLYTSTPVRKQLVEWGKRADLSKHITFHVARHTFATLALNFGIDIKVVSKLLGHNAVKTTEIYAKIMDKTKEEAIKKLPKL